MEENLLYLFIESVIKLTVAIIDGYHYYQVQNFIKYSCLKVNSMRR